MTKMENTLLGQWCGEGFHVKSSSKNGENNGLCVILNNEVTNSALSLTCDVVETNNNQPAGYQMTIAPPIFDGNKFQCKTLRIEEVDINCCLPSKNNQANSSILAKNLSFSGELQKDGTTLKIQWKTTHTVGNAILHKSAATKPSLIKPLGSSFKEFEEWIRAPENINKRLIFRGQKNASRLRTSYHRAGKCNLTRYCQEDLAILNKAIASELNHDFRGGTEGDWEYENLLSIAQHYGFPTPLLDWTTSPYVAAFFAYDNCNANNSRSVRIYIFDQDTWISDWKKLQAVSLMQISPHITIRRSISRWNNRYSPQQSIFMFTNIDDIENFIHFQEKQNDRCYLKTFDLPIEEKEVVMKILHQANINHQTLYPGISGICKTVKYELYNVC